MTMKDMKCDVCGEREAIGVASTIMPYSCAYCVECARANAQPAIVFECFYDDFGTRYNEMHEGMAEYLMTWDSTARAFISYRQWAEQKA